MQVTVWYAGMDGPGDSSMHTRIPDCYLHRVTYVRCRIDKIEPPDDEHMVARNMQSIEINIYGKELCSQVGYLQESHRGTYKVDTAEGNLDL